MATANNAVKLGEIIAKSWQDEKFKKQLLASPKDVMQKAGIDIPSNVKVHVLQDTYKARHAVLSDAPLPGQPLNELPKNASLPQVYQFIYGKAQKDAGFKKQFVSDPVGTVRKLGVQVPPGFSLKVFENSATDKYFVIPISPATRISDELSSSELEMVAGGKGGVSNVNQSVNANANVNVNVNADANINAAVQVDVAAAAAVIVAVAVL